MKTNAGLWMAACLAALLATGSALATDGTWVSTGGGGGGDYGRTNNWLGGAVAGGAGSTLYSTTYVQMDLPLPTLGVSTNVTLGNLIVPESAQVSATVVISPGFGAYGRTESLILNSGAEGVPATIQNNSVTNKGRMKIRSDIRLQSDLYISYNPTNQWQGPNTAVYLTGNISEDGARRGLSVLNLVPGNQVSLFGDNTFSGNIEVKQGIVRAQAFTRLGGEGRQFGRDNTIIATNANSQIDLGGFSFGPNQSLLLSGCGVGGMGVLAASQQSPCYTSVWSGPITLAGDSAVGMGYIKSYPRAVGGAIALTGTIGEQGAGRTLIKNSLNTLFLRGTNTYSGGTIVSNGYLSATCRENLGTGPLVFAGGAFLFETPWDITSVAGLVLTNKADVRLRTADQNVIFNGALGPFSGQVYKSGLGTLTLTRAGQHQNLHVCSGAVNLDYTGNREAKLPSAWYVNLYNNASLNIIGGAQPFTNAIHSVQPQAGCAGVVSISGAAGTRFDLEGTASCGVGAGETLDLRAQAGTTLSLSRSSLDANVLNTRITYNGGAFVSRLADGTAIPFASASNDWDTATARHMDVVAATPAAVPTGARIRTLRFNDPSASGLTFGGDTGLTNGAILVTAAMGSTAVHIQGGTLTSSQGSELTVHQYNTQAVLRISSVLTNTPAGGALTLTKTGPGTLVLSDVPNTFSGTIYVLGGTLEIESGQAFGSTNRYVYVYNGATLRLRGQQIFGVSGNNSLFFNEAGGKIDVPDAGDRAIFIGRTGAQSHGLLTKIGKGMFTISGNWSMMANENFLDVKAKTFVVEEGTLDISKNLAGPRLISGETLGTVVVKNNAVLRGALFLSGNGATNGGGSSEDEQGGYQLRVESTGGIVDLDGVSAYMGVSGGETYSCDFISGPGRLTITNSSATAATNTFNGAYFSHFTGIYDGAKYYFRNIGGGLPNGEFAVPDGAAVDFGFASFPYTIALGRLTGTGSFGGKCPDNQAQPPTLVGRDLNETFEYSGYLWGTYNGIGNSAFPFRYTKVGSSTWRISGTTNAMTSDVTIRKGTILVGANSPGNGAVGALGKAGVLLGDASTATGNSLALLTDGPYTVGNTLSLTNTNPGVTVTLGGNQTAGASAFTNALVLTRNVILTSANTDSPNGVTFSGKITGPGGIIKTGVGTVYLTGAVSNTGPTAVQAGQLVVQGNVTLTNTLTVTAGVSGTGALTVNGNLSLGTGATLAVSAGTLVRGQAYTLVTCTGTLSGAFPRVAGLPTDWHVGLRSGSYVLYYAMPGTLLRVH